MRWSLGGGQTFWAGAVSEGLGILAQPPVNSPYTQLWWQHHEETETHRNGTRRMHA